MILKYSRHYFYSLLAIMLLAVASCTVDEVAKDSAAKSLENEIAVPSVLASGCTNRAILFDGVDDYIDLGDILNTTSFPVTIAAWVNVDPATSAGSPVFTSQDNVTTYKGFWLGATTTNVYAEYGDGVNGNNPQYRKGKTAAVSNIPGNWRFVTAVLKGISDVDIYVDGVSAGGTVSGSSTATMSSNDPATAKIARRTINGATSYFKGMMDDVSVWSKALTVTEINQYMNQTPSGSETNLLAYWNFDEASGTSVFDLSPNHSDGAIFGGAQRVVSTAPNHCLNGAVKFDGVNDYIDLSDIYNSATFPMTVSAWVKVDSTVTATAPIFISQENTTLYKGFWIATTNTNVFSEYGDGQGGNNSAYRKGKSANIGNLTNQWKFVTAVLNGIASVDLYVNGVNVGGTVTGSSTLTMSSNDPSTAKIGKKTSNGSTYYFKGTIDDVSVWNRALTATEINQYMNQLLVGTETGLVGYWNFDEPSGTSVLDKSSNHFNGIIVNGALRVASTAPNH